MRVRWLTWKPYVFILALAFRLLSLHAETSVITFREAWEPAVCSQPFQPRGDSANEHIKIIPFAKSYATS